MKQDVWLSAAMRYVAPIVAISFGAFFPRVSIAQIVDIGGQTCAQHYAWYDYYTNGKLTDSQYEPDGITCYDNGGGGSQGGVPGSGGGGGSTNPPDLVDRDISAKLKCALDNYLHNNVKLTGGKTMKKVNAWAFGRMGANGWEYRYRSTNASPGTSWSAVGGRAAPGSAYGRLYNRAFQVSNNFQRDGTRPGASSNSLSGNLTAFETSLFAAGHEASHLNGNPDREAEADWYGIDAVLRYRSDGGAKCASHPN